MAVTGRFAGNRALAAVGSCQRPVGKYIYDVRVCERGSDRLTFTTKFYYDPIPNSERINNPLLIQNNQY